ncbi:MAG: diguanylate cyclase [Gammaproteobacteria bacterium]|nr:diguanylate cyclase [Gammaproteobacteria bacterium]
MATTADSYDFRFEKQVIGVESGLPQSTVRAVTQDEHGLLYFATDDGVSRYNGVSHFLIHEQLTEERKLFSFSDVCAIEDGVVATSFDGGFLIYNHQKNRAREVILVDLLGKDSGRRAVGCSVDLVSGWIWIVSDKSVFAIDQTSIQLSEDAPSVISISTFKDINQEKLIINKSRTVNNRIYLATSSGVWQHSNQQFNEMIELPKEIRNVVDISVSESSLWVVTDYQLLYYQLHNGHWTIEESSIVNEFNKIAKNETLKVIFRENAERLWVGSETKGLFLLDLKEGNVDSVHRDNSLLSIPDNHISSIYKTSDGVMWLGTWLSGVVQLRFPTSGFNIKTSFHTQESVVSLPSIRSIFRSSQGEWLIGTDEDGLLVGNTLYSDFQIFNRSTSPALPSDSVRVISQVDEEQFLLGTESGAGYFNLEQGFTAFSGVDQPISEIIINTASKKKIPAFVLDTTERYVGKRIRDIHIDKQQQLWIGTYDKGLFFKGKDDTQFQQVSLLEPELTDPITSIKQFSPDQLWVATDNSGVYIISSNTKKVVKHFHAENQERTRTPGNSIWAIHRQSDSHFWLGSYGQGLAELNINSGVFKYYDSEVGLPNNVVYCIIDDDLGYLWMSTNRGLARLHRKSGQIHSFYKTHGLTHDEFNSGACFKSPQGNIYFGALQGLVEVIPKEVPKNSLEFKTLVDDVKINGTTILKGDKAYEFSGAIFEMDKLTVAENYQRLEFSFATTEFRNVGDNEFKYRLLGYDETWRHTDLNVNSISYNNLAAGNYRLEVFSKNSNGLWKNKPIAIDIYLLPPWYKSGWAYIAYLLLFASALLACVELFNRYRKRNKEMLSNLHYMVDKRTQELKSKNKQLEDLNRELQIANGKLQKVSLTDPMTGLGNRRMLHQFLERDIGYVNRAYLGLKPDFSNLKEVKQHDLIFFLIDIDNFKQINDQFGHTVGDRVLIEVSNVLSEMSREIDLLIRYGGEEFLLVMRDTPRNEASAIAQRILNAMSGHIFSLNINQNIPITCSIGFAPYPFSAYFPSQLLAEQVIQIADFCLYTAKSSGRNCSVSLMGEYTDKVIELSDILGNTDTLVDDGTLTLLSTRSREQIVWPDKSVSD